MDALLDAKGEPSESKPAPEEDPMGPKAYANNKDTFNL
jgi:hypothetical protein